MYKDKDKNDVWPCIIKTEMKELDKYLLKFINNSRRKYNWKQINCLLSVWKSDEKLLSFASLISPSKIINFVWEVISSIRHSVSSPNETPQTARRIFSFPLGMKHCISCLIYYVKTQPTSIDFRLHLSKKGNGKDSFFYVGNSK